MNTLLYYPIQALSFFSLAMAFTSIWIKKNPLLFGSFGFISVLAAFTSGLLSSIALLPLIFFTLLLFGLKTNLQGLSRFLIASTAFLIGSSLFFHLMPGFLEKEAFHTATCLNYGKALIGLILTGWFVQTSPVKELKSLFFPAILGTLAIISSSYCFNKTSYELYFSISFFSWILSGLFFSIIPEEALLRGFLQKEIYNWLGGGLKSSVSCIGITSMLFLLFHMNWVGNTDLIIPTFTMGLIYGVLYQIYQKVEVCILCHFFVKSCSYLFLGSYFTCP